MTVPLVLALIAGALAPLNPCGFPLLPAFLSFYVGVEANTLPRAPNQIARALLVGLLVTAGFLVVFALIGLPIAYGADLLADALPWAGLAIGIALLTVGLVALAGRRVALPVHRPLAVAHGRQGQAMLLFGAGYGIGALACTLPAFLALVGVSLAAASPAETAAILAAYGSGLALTFMALSLTAALFQQGLVRALRRLAPHMNRISGALLALAGAYLAYYWSRTLFGSTATLATDPLVGPVTMFSARVAVVAADRGLPFVIGIGLVTVVAVAVSLQQWLRRSPRWRASSRGGAATSRRHDAAAISASTRRDAQ